MNERSERVSFLHSPQRETKNRRKHAFSMVSFVYFVGTEISSVLKLQKKVEVKKKASGECERHQLFKTENNFFYINSFQIYKA